MWEVLAPNTKPKLKAVERGHWEQNSLRGRARFRAKG